MRHAIRLQRVDDRRVGVGPALALVEPPRLEDLGVIDPGQRRGDLVADLVQDGATLLTIEAMKMQNELRTPRDGTVERVAVGVGETIDLGDLLMVIG